MLCDSEEFYKASKFLNQNKEYDTEWLYFTFCIIGKYVATDPGEHFLPGIWRSLYTCLHVAFDILKISLSDIK